VTQTLDYHFREHRRHRAAGASSASVIAPLVCRLIEPRSVLDIGCGLGMWLRAFSEYGVPTTFGVDAVDPGDVTLEIDSDQFARVDLRDPLRLPAAFDLVICLEVAEHLPATSAATLVDSCVHHAPAVLFSAAIPRQGGSGHMNEQWPDYWAHLFAQHDYVVCDVVLPRVWTDSRVAWWYAQNVLLFVASDDLARNARIRAECDGPPWRPLGLVHPANYLQKTEPRSLVDRLRRRLLRRSPPVVHVDTWSAGALTTATDR